MEAVEPLHAAMRRMGLVAEGERPELVPLAGGVSSDIYRVHTARGAICLKRALPRLKVRADWKAPVERSRYEVGYMRTAGAIVPGFVPRILGEDPSSGAFAMEYLEPESHPVWKAQLRDGAIDTGTAREVASRLVRVHQATSTDATIAERFATDHIFWPIRLEPYLLATAGAHPDLAPAFEKLARGTAANKRALVHGDVSPKNILAGPRGPVLLDAECAWYGDPAFDLAFLLNHMLLKCLWRPQWRARYLSLYDEAASTYLEGVTWEEAEACESRTARLLPGLFLGRIDGKSPVEYVTEERDRERVRRVARALLARPPVSLQQVREAWQTELAR